MAAEMIKCPSCGKDIPQEVENCPECGAPISAIVNNDISGAPIDNSEAIDAMLRTASQLMEDSESLGLDEYDIVDEDDENAEDEDNEEEEVFDKIELTELPPELSEIQKDKIEAGGVIKLTPSEISASADTQKKGRAKSKKASKSGKKTGDETVESILENTSAPDNASTSDDMPPTDEMTTLNETDLPSVETEKADSANATDNKSAAENSPKKQKKKRKKSKKGKDEDPTLFEVDENGNAVKGKKVKKSKKKEKDEQPKKAKNENKKSSPLKTLIVAVITLVIGVCGGFVGKILLFPDLPTPKCQNFAQKAISAAVNEVAGARDLYIAEAYVKQGVFSTQCIFRTFSESETNVFSEWFRVKIDNDTERTTVYFELSQDEYERLRSSENDEDRARAAVLKSNQNELERCISEMKAGDGWSSANVTLINNNLHPYEEITTTTVIEKEDLEANTEDISEEDSQGASE